MQFFLMLISCAKQGAQRPGSKNCASACSISLTTVKRGPRLRRKPCVEVVKGEKCVGKIIVGFPGSGFSTVLEALPRDEVEDSTSDTPVGLAVDCGDRKSTRLNSSHSGESRMPSSA